MVKFEEKAEWIDKDKVKIILVETNEWEEGTASGTRKTYNEAVGSYNDFYISLVQTEELLTKTLKSIELKIAEEKKFGEIKELSPKLRILKNDLNQIMRNDQHLKLRVEIEQLKKQAQEHEEFLTRRKKTLSERPE